MHETYRMLGREREADLLREAEKLCRAAEARGGRAATAPRVSIRSTRARLGAAGLIELLVRVAGRRAQAGAAGLDKPGSRAVEN
jgi:hypothetical protein